MFMPLYTFEQYEKFFENFEGSNAGMIYKPRTFCSTRLYALIQAILHNIKDEESIKKEILDNPKLGERVVQFMYGDLDYLNKIIKTSKVGHPDFMDAIQRWREALSSKESLCLK
jgi:hypothetical protein